MKTLKIYFIAAGLLFAGATVASAQQKQQKAKNMHTSKKEMKSNKESKNEAATSGKKMEKGHKSKMAIKSQGVPTKTTGNSKSGNK